MDSAALHLFGGHAFDGNHGFLGRIHNGSAVLGHGDDDVALDLIAGNGIAAVSAGSDLQRGFAHLRRHGVAIIRFFLHGEGVIHAVGGLAGGIFHVVLAVAFEGYAIGLGRAPAGNHHIAGDVFGLHGVAAVAVIDHGHVLIADSGRHVRIIVMGGIRGAEGIILSGGGGPVARKDIGQGHVIAAHGNDGGFAHQRVGSVLQRGVGGFVHLGGDEFHLGVPRSTCGELQRHQGLAHGSVLAIAHQLQLAFAVVGNAQILVQGSCFGVVP